MKENHKTIEPEEEINEMKKLLKHSPFDSPFVLIDDTKHIVRYANYYGPIQYDLSMTFEQIIKEARKEIL